MKETRTRPVLPESPSVFEACSFIQSLIEWIGPGYHPDTDFNEYVNASTNLPLFSSWRAMELNREHERACSILDAACIDPCSVGLKVQRRLICQMIQQRRVPV